MLALSLAIAHAGTVPNHCLDLESPVFSCEVKGSKILSLCLGQPAPNPTYLQYRFGPKGAPELVWPPNPAAGFAPFHVQTQAHVSGESTTVAFSNGAVTYEVFEMVGSGPENNGAGVSIQENGKHLATVSCVGEWTASFDAIRPFVAEGGADAPVDPLKGLSKAQVCASDSLALLQHGYEDLATRYHEICCGPEGLVDSPRCEMDWPFNDVPSCEAYDSIRNGIYARYGRPFTTEKWKVYFAGRDWYVPNVHYQDSWVPELAQKNAAILKDNAAKQVGCFD